MDEWWWWSWLLFVGMVIVWMEHECYACGYVINLGSGNIDVTVCAAVCGCRTCGPWLGRSDGKCGVGEGRVDGVCVRVYEDMCEWETGSEVESEVERACVLGDGLGW